MQSIKLLFILLVFSQKALTLLSQTKADSISLTFPKIIIENNHKQILLAFDNNRKAFEVPSIGIIDGPISFKSYIDTIAAKLGIKYKFFRLGGIFTYIFPDKYSTFIRPYFVVQLQGFLNGKNILDSSYKWFSVENALKEIKYPASERIVRKIMKYKKRVWSATFEEYGYTNPVDISKIKFRIIEDFSKLN